MTPPPLLPEIDTRKYCEFIQKKKDFSDEDIYLISKDIDLNYRVTFEYFLHEKYNLFSRYPIDSIDEYCIKPIFDKYINEKLNIKSESGLIAEINILVKKLQDSIGEYQIKKGVYFTASTFPKYATGIRNMYFNIIRQQGNLTRHSKKTGRAIFYININAQGCIDDIYIYRSIDKETDSLSYHIMKHLPESWSPAMVGDTPVNFWYQYAIDW